MANDSKVKVKVEKEDIEQVSSIPFAGFFDSIPTQFSPIESLRYREDDEGSLTFYSDVFFVLNMNRIATALGVDTARAIVSSMNASSSRSSISPDIPDKDRLLLTKSRYIQSVSELSAWFSSLDSQLGSIKQSYDKLLSDIHEQEIVDAAKKVVSSTASTVESD